MEATTTALSSGWSFKRADAPTRDWAPVDQVPTEVHLDLLKHGKISDPYVDINEISTRWVADHSWAYLTKIPPEKLGTNGAKTDLVFQGLDTFATVFINGKVALKSDNMFVEHRISLDDFLEARDRNEETVVEIIFESARKRGLELVKEHSEHRFIVHQTEISRGPVRKAQYHWGWDWGPILLTCGPWKPVLLETYFSRIDDTWLQYTLSPDLKKVEVSLYATIVGESPDRVSLNLIFDGQSVHSSTGSKETDGTTYKAHFALEDPKLWWPRGYGDQKLYQIEAKAVAKDGRILDKRTKLVGFRKTELLQEKDAIGQSFYFRINNVDIFSGGSCWIPADSFVSRITPQRYRDWVALAAEGNQTMIRVWGGGIYEADAFYEACDEYGVLVWQDFMFACANYPAYPEYLESVETEARQNVRRLRNHPSIIIWAGNNEDYQIVERYGLEYRFDEDKDPQSWLKTDFPARYLYEHLLPKVISEETSKEIYHPSSPWGNGKSTVLKVDPTVGDIHQWNVWHGEMKLYQQLPDMGGRFISEFGMEAYPSLETIESFVTQPEQRYPGSMVMDFHNKAIGHERRMITYVAENFQVKYDLPSFTHLTQVVQAEAMAWAYKSWRRNWGTAGARKCGGVLVWQLNDCYPTMSWAVVDYYLVKKLGYYAIRRALKPIAVGVTRKFHNWTMRHADALWQRDTGHVNPTEAFTDTSFDVWVSSSRPGYVKCTVVVKFFSIRTGKEIHDKVEYVGDIAPNGTSEVIQNQTLTPPANCNEKSAFNPREMDPFVIAASVFVDGEVVSTDYSWPDPIKYLDLSDRKVEVKYSDDKSTAIVTAAKPVKAFGFSEKRGVGLSDNGFDVVPGEPHHVSVVGIAADKLEWTYVGKT